MKKICGLHSDKHFFINFFPDNAFAYKISSKLSGFVWPCNVSIDGLNTAMCCHHLGLFAPTGLRLRLRLNPLTLKSSSIVCFFHTFGINLGIIRKFSKYFKESCCSSSDQHFSFKFFSKNAYVRKIFPKLSCLFWPP